MTDPKTLTRRNVLALAGLGGLATTLLAGVAGAQTPKQRRKHPRLVKALDDLTATKQYLEETPNKFGGHKAKAITAIEVAMVDLKLALEFDE